VLLERATSQGGFLLCVSPHRRDPFTMFLACSRFSHESFRGARHALLPLRFCFLVNYSFSRFRGTGFTFFSSCYKRRLLFGCLISDLGGGCPGPCFGVELPAYCLKSFFPHQSNAPPELTGAACVCIRIITHLGIVSIPPREVRLHLRFSCLFSWRIELEEPTVPSPFCSCASPPSVRF